MTFPEPFPTLGSGGPQAESGRKLGSARHTLWLIVILAVVGAIYLSTLSVNHTEAEDSLYYLASISYGDFGAQFHPNHLLYNPINYLFFQAWRGLGYQGNAELPVKVVNVVAGLCALAIVYVIAVRLQLPVLLRFFTVLVVAFSYGFWWYSVECETYIIPIPFILLALYQLLLIEKDFLPWRHHLLLGTFSAIAILLHQQHALLCIVIFLGYFWIYLRSRRAIGWRRFVGRFMLWGGTCGGIVLAVYLLVATVVAGVSSLAGIRDWVSANTASGGYGYGLSLRSLKGLLGFSRAFVGGHFLFSFPTISDLVQRLVPNYELKEEVFLVQDLPKAEGFVLAGLSVLLASLIMLAVVILIRRGTRGLGQPSGAAGYRFPIFVLSGYVVIYGLFNLCWVPESLEFWISVVPVFVLIFGLLTVPVAGQQPLQAGMALFVVCLFVVNLAGSVLPQTEREHDYWYTFNSWVISNARRGDLVVSGSGYISDGYVHFYSGADLLGTLVPGKDPEREFESYIARHQPNRVFFSSTVYLPPRELVNRTYLDVGASKRFFVKMRQNLKLVHEDRWQQVYLYDRNPK